MTSPDDFRDRSESLVESRITRLAVVVLAVIAVMTALVVMGPILTPLLLAVVLYYMIKPAAAWLTRWHIPAAVAYLVLFVLVILAFVVLGNVIYVNAVELREQLPEYEQRLLGMANGVAARVGLATRWESFTELVPLDERKVFEYAFGTAFGVLENTLMVFFYLIFVILNGRKLPHRVRRALPADSADRVVEIGRKIDENIQQYLKIKTVVSLGMGACATILCWMFGMPYALLWGFLTFALNYITYLGSIVACALPMLLAIVAIESWPAALALMVLLGANRFVWIDYVEIRFSGRQLNLDPVLLLASLAFWGWTWGVLGMILAVPMLTCLKLVLNNFESTRRLAILMSDE